MRASGVLCLLFFSAFACTAHADLMARVEHGYADSNGVNIHYVSIVPCLANSLNYDEPKNVKNKALPDGQVGTFPRDATRLLAFMGHPKGASHGPSGCVAILDKVPDIAFGSRANLRLANAQSKDCARLCQRTRGTR